VVHTEQYDEFLKTAPPGASAPKTWAEAAI
jgi:hypothetical protein